MELSSLVVGNDLKNIQLEDELWILVDYGGKKRLDSPHSNGKKKRVNDLVKITSLLFSLDFKYTMDCTNKHIYLVYIYQSIYPIS